MQQIQGSQIRAARAILNWSQEELARRAGLAVTTVRNIEGGSSLRGKTMIILRDVFEKGGLEFTEREGVRRNVEDMQVFHEPDSCVQFADDLLQTVRVGGDEILASVFSYKMLLHNLYLTEKDDETRLKKLCTFARIKCLLPEESETPAMFPQINVRMTSALHIRPTPYYVYADKIALVTRFENGEYRFVILRAPSIAQAYRTFFRDVWKGETLEGLAEIKRKHL